MKKIVAILFLFAFGFGMNAQTTLSAANVESTRTKEAKLNPKEAAHRDVSEITSIIEVTPEFKNDLMTLFMMREEAMQNAATEDEKVITYQRFAEKMMSGFTDEQRKLLEQKPELYARLMKYKPIK